MQITVIHQAFEDQPLPVACVTIPQTITNITQALEFAFAKTQNTDGSWSMGISPDFDPRVVRLAPLHRGKDGRPRGLRSTSVGDTMEVDGRVFKVAGVGFEAER